jgi:hypothetical protein
MTGKINEDYFKPSQRSDTPIADSLARYANQQLKDMGVEDIIETKVPETKPETKGDTKNPFDKGFVI